MTIGMPFIVTQCVTYCSMIKEMYGTNIFAVMSMFKTTDCSLVRFLYFPISFESFD